MFLNLFGFIILFSVQIRSVLKKRGGVYSQELGCFVRMTLPWFYMTSRSCIDQSCTVVLPDVTVNQSCTVVLPDVTVDQSCTVVLPDVTVDQSCTVVLPDVTVDQSCTEVLPDVTMDQSYLQYFCIYNKLLSHSA